MLDVWLERYIAHLAGREKVVIKIVFFVIIIISGNFIQLLALFNVMIHTKTVWKVSTTRVFKGARHATLAAVGLTEIIRSQRRPDEGTAGAR
jgi:hypothetical protein